MSLFCLQGFNELEKLLKSYNICIAQTEKLLKDSGVPSQEFYDKIVNRLKKVPNARGKKRYIHSQNLLKS